MTRHSADQIADHARDHLKHEPSPRFQKRAVIELVGYLHGLLNPGIPVKPVLSPEIEKQLRSRIRNVCVEFDIDPPGGRVKESA